MPQQRARDRKSTIMALCTILGGGGGGEEKQRSSSREKKSPTSKAVFKLGTHNTLSTHLQKHFERMKAMMRQQRRAKKRNAGAFLVLRWGVGRRTDDDEEEEEEEATRGGSEKRLKLHCCMCRGGAGLTPAPPAF